MCKQNEYYYYAIFTVANNCSNLKNFLFSAESICRQKQFTNYNNYNAP